MGFHTTQGELLAFSLSDGPIRCLRQLRRQKDLTQEQLLEASGISVNMLSLRRSAHLQYREIAIMCFRDSATKHRTSRCCEEELTFLAHVQ